MAIARSIGKSCKECKFEINFFIHIKMDSIVSSKNQQHSKSNKNRPTNLLWKGIFILFEHIFKYIWIENGIVMENMK